jgi:hypothetical protein
MTRKNTPENALRRRVQSLSKKDLVDLVYDGAARRPEILSRVEHRIAARTSPAKAVAKITAAIDQVLDVRFVKWNEVREYIRRLDDVLSDIVFLGKEHPAEAIPAALYYVEAIPRVFDSIDCEDELGAFCTELAELVISLHPRAGLSPGDTMGRLLDAFEKDRHCQFSEIPELLGKARLPKRDRDWLMDEARKRRGRMEAYHAGLVDAMIKALASRSR